MIRTAKIYPLILLFISLGMNMLFAQTSSIDDFDELYVMIRDGKISKQDAIQQLNTLTEQINNLYYGKGGVDYSKENFCFPLKGYNQSAIGGKNGSGYITKGYDFFEGNRHGGHPAHDIFVYDKNQDCNDDRTGNPIDVLSMSGGIVVALSNDWEPTSDLRGGKFVMIYDPGDDAIYYYAHNNKVSIELGDIVEPCQKIAEVGRSGLNAYKQKSPTHLHISRFLVNGGDIIPDDLYQDLLKSKAVE